MLLLTATGTVIVVGGGCCGVLGSSCGGLAVGDVFHFLLQ